MDYTNTAQSGNSYTHQWDVATVRVFDGGFLFDKTTVPTGTEKLPRGSFLKVDQTERKATMIKTATLQAALLIGDEVVKVKKGSLLIATDVLGSGAKAVVTGTIDTSNADYDSFAITAGALGALAIGTVLQTYDAAGSSGKSPVNPDGLNYADVAIDSQPTCSVIYKVDGIVPSRLPNAPTDAIKTALKFCQFLTT